MEQHYLMLIWQVFGLKKNENLSNEEKQKMILEILSSMKKMVEDSTKSKLKKDFIKTVTDSLNNL